MTELGREGLVPERRPEKVDESGTRAQVESEGWPERGARSSTVTPGKAKHMAEADQMLELITEPSGSFCFLSEV